MTLRPQTVDLEEVVEKWYYVPDFTRVGCTTNCGTLYSAAAEVSNIAVCTAACLAAQAACVRAGNCALTANWVEVQ